MRRPPGRRTTRVVLRPTTTGLSALALGIALGAAGLIMGNNAVFLVACLVGALLAVDAVAGWFNLRGVSVLRRLPAEIVAGREALGVYLIAVERRWTPARALTVSELDQGSVAIDRVPADGELEVPTRWSWAVRGRHELAAIRVTSGWPFGFTTAAVDDARGSRFVIVYPELRAPLVSPGRGSSGSLQLASGHGEGVGDFAGLRRFRDGDALRRVHWPTSGRVGRLMVVRRAADEGREAVIRVRDVVGRAWEAEIATAGGAVDDATRRGLSVALQLPGGEMTHARGGAGRRVLLEVLATLPFRDADGGDR